MVKVQSPWVRLQRTQPVSSSVKERELSMRHWISRRRHHWCCWERPDRPTRCLSIPSGRRRSRAISNRLNSSSVDEIIAGTITAVAARLLLVRLRVSSGPRLGRRRGLAWLAPRRRISPRRPARRWTRRERPGGGRPGGGFQAVVVRAAADMAVAVVRVAVDTVVAAMAAAGTAVADTAVAAAAHTAGTRKAQLRCGDFARTGACS